MKEPTLNTTTGAYHSQNLAPLYCPTDPKYLYPMNTVLAADTFYCRPSPLNFEDKNAGYGLEDLMLHKREIIHYRIGMLLSEIYQRYGLRKENLYKICLDQCTCRNLIFEMGEDIFDGKRIELERKIIDLEQEKRRENVGYFRDILFLKKQLRESLIEKLEEEQKAMFLTK